MTSKQDELLDHEVDGIREFDNALPRWWLYGFYFTMLFAGAYLVNYHVLPKPLVGAASVVAEYEADVAAAARTIKKPDPNAPGALVAFTDRDNLEKGRAIFEGSTNVCFSCHRQDLGGLIGPNLTDNLWIHGCAFGQLVANVKTGFPQMGMLPFGTGQQLTDEQVLQVVSYVFSKHGSQPPNPKPVDPEREKPCP